MENIGVNNTLTYLSQIYSCDNTSDEVKKMYQNINKKQIKKFNTFTRIYGKESTQEKFEKSYLKLIQERNQIKEYKPLRPEFTAMSLYYSKRIF